MKFDNQLHEDLFDLFIVNWFVPNKISCIYDEEECDYELKRVREEDPDFRQSLMDLFPQEIHPEQYEGYMHNAGLIDLRAGWECRVWSQKVLDAKKVIIQVEQE